MNEKAVSLTFDSSLSDICNANSSFDTGVLRICYTGKNRNGSAISREDIERSLKTIYNCPIVCSYDRETDTLGGHEVEVVACEDGSLKLVNLTQPVGVIPESANTWFADYEESDGTVHEYLYADVLLWKRQEAYQKIKRGGTVSHSMEINVKDAEEVDGVYHIKDFEFTAFALIGVEPCFESSAIEVFANREFKSEFAQMMKELKEEFSIAKSACADDKDDTEGGCNMLENSEEIMESVVTENEVFTAEEVVSNDEHNDDGEFAICGNVEEGSEETAEENPNEEEFALNSNIVEELRSALRHITYRDRWGDECHKYWYVDCDVDASMVYCEDCQDWRLYGMSYSMTGDAITIDFETKKRMKWIIAEFVDGEEDSPVSAMFNELEQKAAENYEWKKKYEDASSDVAAAQSELEDLRAFKKNAEDEAARCAKEAIFAKFDDLYENDAFVALKKEAEKYDAETLEEKCFAIRGRSGAAAKQFSKEAAPRIMVDKTDDAADEPYGGIFIKYKVR